MKSELIPTRPVPACTAQPPEVVQTITATTSIPTISVRADVAAATSGSTPRTSPTEGADHV